MKKRNFLPRDNRGMTLVELLVGITILALIVSPLLHTFITAGKTSQKSARLGLATTAGQNIAERIEATHMKDLTAAVNTGNVTALFGSGVGVEYYVLDDDGDYKPAGPADLCEQGLAEYRIGLRDLTYGSTRFDALITLDATDFSDSQLVKITQYTPMDAVFAQPYGRLEDPDLLAAEHFANEATRLSGVGHDADDFRYQMNRIIKISVVKDETAKELTATARYEYKYSFTYTLRTLNPDGTETTTTLTEPLAADYSYEFYRSRIVAPEEGEEAPAGLTSIYFFFYPNYQTTAPSTGYKDNIYIYNKNDLPFTAFLIKQRTPYIYDDVSDEVGDGVIIGYDTAYTSVVRQYHSLSQMMAPAQVFSNLNMAVAGDEPQSVSSPSYHMYRGDTFYREGALTGELVFTKPENRFYGLRVELFEPGADLFSAKPLYAIDASKLD